MPPNVASSLHCARTQVIPTKLRPVQRQRTGCEATHSATRAGVEGLWFQGPPSKGTSHREYRYTNTNQETSRNKAYRLRAQAHTIIHTYKNISYLCICHKMQNTSGSHSCVPVQDRLMPVGAPKDCRVSAG